jgi:hypothetical protein
MPRAERECTGFVQSDGRENQKGRLHARAPPLAEAGENMPMAPSLFEFAGLGRPPTEIQAY